MTKQAFSAPGKAFFAGGYLVLDPKYYAYVVALSSRMHAVVEGGPIEGDVTEINTTSPQFKQGDWAYKCKLNTLDITSSNKNPFIECVVRAILAYVNPQSAHRINVTIWSDDEYHSQQSSRPTRTENGRFVVHDQAINKVPKTGLGSSAALTVVVTTALLSYYLNTTDRQLVHNLSQLAHCTAQGKVGSGFDVASAVYGSTVYKRFAPQVLGDLTDPVNQDFVSVKNLVDSKWVMEAMPCSLPAKYALLMGDVCGGSETPKLVSKVLQWRKDNSERALEVWTKLDAANMGFVELLKTGTSNDNLSRQIQEIRTWLKVMGKESGAPIEPDEQTTLLDSVCAIDGVVGGVVPGAGGYDAIALLVEADKIENIKQAASQSELSKHVQWFNLREESKGVVKEDPNSY